MSDKPALLNELLASYGVEANCESYTKIRNIGLYNLRLHSGAMIKDIRRVLEELSVCLGAYSKPMLSPQYKLGIIRLEVPEERSSKIDFFETKRQLQENATIPVYLGNSVEGEDITFDLSKNPHTIIAGATGSGKSTMLHSLIANLIPQIDVSTTLIDTKAIEFDPYKDTFANVKVITSYEAASELFIDLMEEMNNRYETIRKNKLPTDFYTTSKNNGAERKVIIIDEYADLIINDGDKTLRRNICNLAQKCRAAGMFIIIATQRPSVKILDGNVKANFPARISCQTASGIDSRVILDVNGAEDLVGAGDSIIHNSKYSWTRFQCAYATAKSVIENLKPETQLKDFSSSCWWKDLNT
jgi:S-DNA-T family DNA segregation ATPase FtsK/SpoIIIE